MEFVCTEQDTHNGRATTYKGPFPSGAPGIFIDQVARVGARTIFLGAVGNDAFGNVLRERLTSVGVQQDLITTADGWPTGSAFVAYNGDGSRDFVFNITHSAASRFPTGAEAISALTAAGVTAFHISGSTLGNPEMARAALAVCRALAATGVGISFDPNVRKEVLTDPAALDVVRGLLDIATWVLPSEEDAAILYPDESFETYAKQLLAGSAQYVVLKRGDRGCQAMNRAGEVLTIPAHGVDVVDPTGAGDCFCGTFVAITASSASSFGDALVRANAAGALAVTRLGPMEGNSTLAEIDAFLARAS